MTRQRPMPFPFIPGGLLLALFVMGGTMVLFGLALKALDWTVDATRRTVLVGIVSGLQDWQMSTERGEATASSPSAPAMTESFEEAFAGFAALEPVESEGTRRRGAS